MIPAEPLWKRWYPAANREAASYEELPEDLVNASTALGGITEGGILDRDGKVLMENVSEGRWAMEDSIAYFLTDAMTDSMEMNRLFSRSGVSVQSTSTRRLLTI